MNQLRFGTVGVFLLACGASERPKVATVDAPPPPPAPVAAPVPSASAAPARSELPALWTCDGGRGPTVKAPPADNAPPPVVGPMTEASAQAKRKYDAEKWKDAETELRRVVKGETGDDEGNKQVAEYRLAVVLFRLERQGEAVDAFRAIAKHRNHVKHGETLLWLSRLADQRPESLTLEDFSTYAPEDVLRFNNDNQRALYTTLSFFVGRERLAENRDAEAKKLLANVPEEHAYGAAAKKCLALAK